MAGRRRAALIALAASLFARAAAADAPARVSLAATACDEVYDRAQLGAALRIELEADGVRELVEGAQDVLATIHVDVPQCRADAREIVVVIDDAATSKSVRRTIAIDAVARDARARALALAIAELLRASWAEISVRDAPPAALPPSIVAAVRLRPEPARPRTIAALALSTQLFPSYQSIVLGPALARAWEAHLPELGASIPIAGPLRARAAGGVSFGRAYDSLGTIDLGLAYGELGLALAGGSETVRFEIGPAATAGYGWATGHPASSGEGGHVSGAVVSGALATSLAVRLAGDWWSLAGVEAGGVLASLDARASNRAASGFGGPLVGISLGVGREL